MAAYYRLVGSLLLLPQLVMGLGGRIQVGSKLSASENQTWVSETGTFAFGFTASDSGDGFWLGIWYAQLPGGRNIVWSANRDFAVGKGAVVRFESTGDLVLLDGDIPVWSSNTPEHGGMTAEMEDSGNLVVFSGDGEVVWQSFWYPTDTLLPGQPLNASLELASPRTPLGYYSLRMLQQSSSLTLGLSYISPKADPALPEFYANYTYWSGPQISNTTGDIAAMLDKSGNFVVTYGASPSGTVYIHRNDSAGSSLHLRRVRVDPDGNLRLYRWDDHGGWVTEWSAMDNPCEVAGVCGSGICSLDVSKTNASCSCPPGTSPADPNRGGCSSNALSLPPGNCTNSSIAGVHMETMAQTKYYFSGPTILANYSGVSSSSQCGEYCLSDCRCVASLYGLLEDNAHCWTLRYLVFGGFQDPSSTLFMKVSSNGSHAGVTPGFGRGRADGSGSSSGSRNRRLALVLPLILCFSALAALLGLLLYYNINGNGLRRLRSIDRCLTVPGAPINFTYQELQAATSNFSQMLGAGGFGSVYKGSLRDGTLVAVKKLDRMLPHGEKEFITEVTTIGSMHHMNLVRLCGFCSEGSHRLLVYEYMSNGSLDQWIFPSRGKQQERLLDWSTRFRIAAGIAQGIAYFHEQCRDRIIHCDIKPENILLDENFHPKVSDFGLAKLMGREHSQVVTMVRGTRGYLAPEWISNRPVTVKADVYSYGMVLLEIVGGRRNLDVSQDAEDFFFPGWAFKEMMEGNPAKVADKRLKGGVVEEEVARALNAAFWCIQEEVWARPSMGEVIRILEGSAEIKTPPVPQAVVEIMEEGWSRVYRAMRRSYFGHAGSSSALLTTDPSSQATCSYSTMSPR